MAPSVQLPDGAENGATRVAHGGEITILVTGFGPFQDKYPVNPSFEIVKRLPALLPAESKHKTSVRLVRYEHPIRVAYDGVRDLVPKLHESYKVDLVLHIGMASGRKFYCIERYGHRDGYKNRDLDGTTPPFDEGKTTFRDCPATMTTSLDYDNILLNWQVNLLGIPEGSPGNDVEARSSDDAGHYLCDYIYFNSLAHLGRRSGRLEGGDNPARPALFLHVPAESDNDSLERGTAAAITLIRAMADNFAKSKTSETVVYEMA
jgi:pyrrolidone-carboxylate peptidase